MSSENFEHIKSDITSQLGTPTTNWRRPAGVKVRFIVILRLK
jgi:hypothetical protein